MTTSELRPAVSGSSQPDTAYAATADALLPSAVAALAAAASPSGDDALIGRIVQSLHGATPPTTLPASTAHLPIPALPDAAAAPLVPSFAVPAVPVIAVPAARVPNEIPSAVPTPRLDYYFLTGTPAAVAPAQPVPKVTDTFTRRPFDVSDVRADFPILQERIHGRPLIWFDNAATTQKPRAVIDRIVRYYEHEYSNVHRGAHTLAARSTDAYEAAREKVQRFLGAGQTSEIVFVRGTTEAVNLVANSWGRRHVHAGDEIVLTTIEHHSNIVPWQFLAEAVGAKIRVVPVTDRGEVLLEDGEKVIGERTRLVAVTHVSNALGTVVPVAEITKIAHRYGARVLVDGAQAVSHFPVNVQAIDADFYALSGHKMFGPSAVGVLYGKKALLDEMPPWQGGGNMIEHVSFERSTFADPPARFEAGTGTLAPAVGLGAAVDYLERIGMANVARHEHELLVHATEGLRRIAGVRLIGTAPEKAGVISFLVDGCAAEDVGTALDQEGIAVRSGHHCAQPTMERFGVTSTVRPSFALYNTHDEVDALLRAVSHIARR